MSARAVLGLTTLLLAAGAGAARADGLMPPGLKTLKPYQVVEQIMAQRELLTLTNEQFARLDRLSLNIRTEPHRFIHRGGKPHETRHLTMVTRTQAYDRAVAILTPDQADRLQALFPVAAPPERARPRYTRPHGKP